MPDFQPIRNDRHAALRWKRTGSFSFAARDAVAPLALDEVPRAALAMPIAFVADSAESGKWLLVAVQALQQDRNLCVGADGVWRGDYVPAIYRSVPFRLATVEGGQRVLCIDEERGLAADGEEGEPFFGSDGKPTGELSQIWAFLNRLAESREATQRACALFARHGLIQPWPIEFDSGEHKGEITGLFRIDSAALDALPIETLDELRKAGALQLAYVQPITGQNFSRLVRYAQRPPAAPRANGAAGAPTLGGQRH